jgi:hypothetical protein
VGWEIEQAINRGLPIIVVNLNGKKDCDHDLCPNLAKNTLSVHIPFGSKIMQYTLEHWPGSHEKYLKEGKGGSYKYVDFVYKKLGLQ